jgi:hypothetical protein
MLDLGFVSAILAEKSFEEVIEFASKNQFKCVEIMCWPVGKAERRYAGVTHINVDETGEEDVSRIRKYSCFKQCVHLRSGLLSQSAGP